MNGMLRKLTVGGLVTICTAVPLFAGPGGPPPHQHGGSSGVRLAADIVGLVRTAVAPIGIIAAPCVTAPVVVPPAPRVVVAPPAPYYVNTPYCGGYAAPYYYETTPYYYGGYAAPYYYETTWRGYAPPPPRGGWGGHRPHGGPGGRGGRR